MALKRKRSSPTFSSPTSQSSGETITSCSSPLPSFYPQSKPVEALHHKATWSFPTYDDTPSSQHLNSRTRKRHRDDRPDEEAVYASTLNKLFNAQRHNPHASPIQSHSALPSAPPVQPVQRSTLHSFWQITQPPSTIPMTIDSRVGHDTESMATAATAMQCEDCDRPFRRDDDNAMEIDEARWEVETACQACSRQVCDRCAVDGKMRLCLACAS